MVSLHTRFLAFPPQRPAQHLLPPSPMHYFCAAVASSFILRRCAPVTLFVYQARRLFERACRTGAGATTPSTHARQCSNSPLAVVGAFQVARKSIAWDFLIFVNNIDAWLHFLLARVRNLIRTFVEECWKYSKFPNRCGRPQSFAIPTGSSSKLCSSLPRPPTAPTRCLFLVSTLLLTSVAADP